MSLAHVRLLRPRQLTKNAFCLAGVLFSGRFVQFHYIVNALLVFLAFAAVSSAVYILNDLIDRDRDRQHPRKRLRPLASGEVRPITAIVLALGLLTLAAVIAVFLNWLVFGCLALYLANNAIYSLRLKHMALFDVLCIAAGFVLRLVAGIYAVEDLPTTWITLCTFFLTVFLGFAKRRAELAGIIPEQDKEQRPVLSKYTLQFLDSLVSSTAIMTVMCYALFTTTSGKNPTLVVSVPIVFFAVMHYKRLVVFFQLGEEPERIVLRDLRLQLSILLWLVVYFGVTYSNIHLFRLPDHVELPIQH